jgi:hypothetical protein
MPKIKEKQQGQQQQMGRYRLLESIHVEPDWKAEQPRDEDGNLVFPWRRPSVQFTRGQVVTSPTDLVAKFGSNKFQYLGAVEGPTAMRSGGHQGAPTPGDPVPDIAAGSPASFPGGQVSTGLQVTTTGPDGKPVSGPMTEETQPNAVADPKSGQRKLGEKPNYFGKPQAGPGKDRERTPDTPRTPRQATEDEAGEPAGPATKKYSRDDLEDKTVAELRDMAEEDEVDLSGAKTKEDIIQRFTRG